MTTTRSVSTRHLVDPELLAPLDYFPQFEFSAEALPAIRQGLSQAGQGGPDPAQLYPGVSRSEQHVPGHGTDPSVRVLVYEPTQRSAVTTGLIWVHGGGFVLGQADDDETWCRRMVAETGTVVVSVDHRLAPETPAPGPLDDCYAALTWLHGAAADLRIDPVRIAVGGSSAGAGLAACLAILARDRGEVTVGFQLLIFPMLDDRTATTVDAHPHAGEFIWTPENNRFGWSALLGHEPGDDDTSPYAAAARVDSVERLPRTYISVGALDLFLEEDLAYATRLLCAGIPTELHVYPGAYHGYFMNPEARVAKAHFSDSIGALRAFVQN